MDGWGEATNQTVEIAMDFRLRSFQLLVLMEAVKMVTTAWQWWWSNAASNSRLQQMYVELTATNDDQSRN